MKRLSILTAVWLMAVIWTVAPQTQSLISEAPTGFDNLSNGFVPQPEFDAALETFAEQESIADGLGPVYNAQSCGECHQNPVVGSGSQIVEQRAGTYNKGVFTDHPGGSLIHSRAIDATIQEHIINANVLTFRTSLSVLGDGFVEAIDDATLQAIAAEQPQVTNGKVRGQVLMVPVNEASNVLRAGRFGWKNQHASLKSFAADAYLNEMGITSPLQPAENTSNGFYVGFGSGYDNVAEPEDDGEDIDIFATFMRATKAPPRDADIAATPLAQLGELLFNQIGCNVCHRPSITTAAPGTVINGGTLTVPDALGNKVIHPFGDFLLHDIGTGDGIVQNGGPETRTKVRTAPLWGLRTRNRLMHDGLSFTLIDAIQRHDGEAQKIAQKFKQLKDADTQALLLFLSSL